MSKEQKFYRCKHCGNIITKLFDAGVPVVCCGEDMAELVANTSDGAKEKHVPVVEVEGNKVTVSIGSVAHPMLEEHHIAWVYLQTNSGGQLRYLEVGAEPKAYFALSDGETAVTAFEYCNLHGLWKADI
ncbi:desulfoferrodoxin family protein [Sinanaerobacter chloroacetimidivorans]|jgi:superoxide reductase|uniref:Desulfoferrodoxin n=1 Tax=Sinanaerobacter chloroacetimidivorans TaxID=2818044 RepID=A0A8J7W3T6_9FIRM|nr:desulfoferrodoxin family protein [Sinanaerobacter chloroacetimidivorans]MBR0600359.1 desulfoferrodoxin [Sinanaerobacter chloroacetimidivorans]